MMVLCIFWVYSFFTLFIFLYIEEKQASMACSSSILLSLRPFNINYIPLDMSRYILLIT